MSPRTMGIIMFHMYSIVDTINLSFILFLRVFWHITPAHIQYHVTTIRCVSTCINKPNYVQLMVVSKGFLANYFDFWKGKMKHTVFISFLWSLF